MTIFARVQSGAVMELFATDQPIAGLFNAAIQWADVTTAIPAVQIGWLLQPNGSFTVPASAPIIAPALTLGGVQAQLAVVQAQVAALVAAAAAH